MGGPNSKHSLPAHSAGVATSKKTYSIDSLGLQGKLSTYKGLLLKGPHIVIPSCLHEEYLERLHHGHLSVAKVQQNAHQHLHWPGLDADIIDYTRRCQECVQEAHSPKEPLQPQHCQSEGPSTEAVHDRRYSR